MVGWVKAVKREIRGRGIVKKRVQGCDNWAGAKEVGERVSGGVIESRVDNNCEERGDEAR